VASATEQSRRGALAPSDLMITISRRRLMEAVRSLQDKGTVPPGADDPGIASAARSGDLIASESQPRLEV
jgi:hypothetical protein